MSTMRFIDASNRVHEVTVRMTISLGATRQMVKCHKTKYIANETYTRSKEHDLRVNLILVVIEDSISCFKG